MSSSVCQGLQSCLEPRLVEPLVLRLKLTPLKSNFSHSSAWTKTPTTENNDSNDNTKSSFDDSENKNNNNGELGGWSFIQALTNTPQTPKKSPENDADEEKVYVHPLAKHSASKLSEKSLEMCTEGLGSETGSEISESMAENLSYLSDSADFSPKSHSKNRGSYWADTKKTCRHGGGSFPPPLTSFSGSGGCVRVKPQREGGRLVIKAVMVSSSRSFFHAERGNGCLRLHLLKDNSGYSDIKAVDEERDEAIDEDDDDEAEVEGGDVEKECDDSVCWGEDMDGAIEKVGGEMGMEKFQKPSRCKEGGLKNKGLWNLKAYLVATS